MSLSCIELMQSFNLSDFIQPMKMVEGKHNPRENFHAASNEIG